MAFHKHPSALTTSDDIPVASSCSIPSPPPPRRSVRLQLAIQNPRARGSRAYTASPTRPPRIVKGKGKAVDNLRGTVSEGMPPTPRSSKLGTDVDMSETEVLPQLIVQREPLGDLGRYDARGEDGENDDNDDELTDDSGAAYPELPINPSNPRDSSWFYKAGAAVLNGSTALHHDINALEAALQKMLADACVVEYELALQMEEYRVLLKEIEATAGKEFVEKKLKKTAESWYIPDLEERVAVHQRPTRLPASLGAQQQQPQQPGQRPEELPALGSAIVKSARAVHVAVPLEAVSSAAVSSSPPDSPTNRAAMRTQKRRRDVEAAQRAAVDAKRPRVFFPPTSQGAPRPPTVQDYSSLPPSSPIRSEPSSPSPSSEPAAQVLGTQQRKTLGKVREKSSDLSLSLGLSSEPQLNGWNAEGIDPCSETEDPNDAQLEAQVQAQEHVEGEVPVPAGPAPIPALVFSPGFMCGPAGPSPTKSELMRDNPWYIPPPSSQMNFSMAWSPKADKDKRGAAAEGEDDDEGSGRIPIPDASAFIDVNTSVQVVESASGAVTQARRAAHKAKKMMQETPPLDRMRMAMTREALQNPNRNGRVE